VKNHHHHWFGLVAFLILLSCGDHNSNDQQPLRPQESEEAIDLEILTEDNDVIWGFDFIDHQNIIYSKRSGSIKLFNSFSKKERDVRGTPNVFVEGEGGLLDIRVAPQDKNIIYMCYAQPLPGGASVTLGRGRLREDILEDFETIYTVEDPSDSSIHFGCRIEFDREGNIFFSTGERGQSELAQNLQSSRGKILHLRPDGSAVKSNFFLNQPEALPHIYSFGHRNTQGLALRPGTDELWQSELGPIGGDEVNIIVNGGNYGWPLVSEGRLSDGGPITSDTTGFIQPIAFWDPSISPSGIAFYTGDEISQWQGNLFLANLSGRHIRRLVLDGRSVIQQEVLFEKLNWRFRNVRQGPDGLLYFSTDEGKLGRIKSIRAP
jgi:aldose sugar dehydrogenase